MKNRIREFRKEKGISQKKLADAIGVSFQSISFFERGDKTPSIENWIKLANFFDVSVPELQGYEEKDQNISIKKMKTLIKDKPNDDYTKSLVTENLRKSQLIDQENKNKLIKQLDDLIMNNQFTDLLLLNSLANTFINLFNENDEIYTTLQTFLRVLLGYIMHEDDRNESDVKESFQELLDLLNKEEK